MKKERFISFLQDNILSLFTGSEIVGEEESSTRDACVALGSGGTVLVKYDREDVSRFIIKRVQPFKSFEVSLIRSIIDEMRNIFKANLSEDIIASLESKIIQTSICKALSKSASLTIDSILTNVASWGRRTYEGNKVKFGFIVSSKKLGKNTNQNTHISHVIKKDYCALISNGENSCLSVSADGFIMGYETLPKSPKENLFSPLKYLDIANACVGAKVGICLLTAGDLLIFKGKQLLFAKRNGKWSCYCHEEIIDKLAERAGESEEIRKAIYLSSLDTSFAKTGGCIVHLNASERNNVLKHIDTCDLLDENSYNYKVQQEIDNSFFKDINENPEELVDFEQFLTEDKCNKSANLIKIINGKKFQELSRELRAELIGVDGATIIDYEGNIIAVGAIIKIEAGSTGGGRLAAAKTLSNYGVSLKISADGSIEGFRMDRSKLRVKPIFVIG